MIKATSISLKKNFLRFDKKRTYMFDCQLRLVKCVILRHISRQIEDDFIKKVRDPKPVGLSTRTNPTNPTNGTCTAKHPPTHNSPHRLHEGNEEKRGWAVGNSY